MADLDTSEFFLTTQNVIDLLEDFRSQLPLLELYCAKHSDFNAKARALAEKAAAIAKKPGSMSEFLPNVETNLKAVEPLSETAQRACQLILEHLKNWDFDSTGKVDSAPQLGDRTQRGSILSMQLSLKDLNAIRAIAFAHYPPKFHDYQTFLDLTSSLFKDKPQVEKPVALITVGPPGSGKSHMVDGGFGRLPFLDGTFSGAMKDSYVEIDPDNWLINLCNSENKYRQMCNMLNLESFFLSINRGLSVVFAGTGKIVRSTAGRVTSRLKEANYRIYYAIVLCTFENCKKRIQERFAKTGRDVPDAVVRDLFKGLQEACPLYIKNQAQLCDALLIYQNNTPGEQPPSPLIVQDGKNVQEALELVKKQLEIPPDRGLSKSLSRGLSKSLSTSTMDATLKLGTLDGSQSLGAELGIEQKRPTSKLFGDIPPESLSENQRRLTQFMERYETDLTVRRTLRMTTTEESEAPELTLSRSLSRLDVVSKRDAFMKRYRQDLLLRHKREKLASKYQKQPFTYQCGREAPRNQGWGSLKYHQEAKGLDLLFDYPLFKPWNDRDG